MNKHDLDRAKKTGNVRFNSERKFTGGERLVLQVEVAETIYDHLAGKTVTLNHWRDATTSDLTRNTMTPKKLGAE